MYKYYKQLDKPKDQILKLNDIDKYTSVYTTKYLDEQFLENNSKVFLELKNISSLFGMVNYDLIDKKIKDPNIKYKVYEVFSNIEQAKYDGYGLDLKGTWDPDKVSYEDLYSYFIIMGKKIEVLKYVFPNNLYYMNLEKDIDKLRKKIINKDIIYEAKAIRYTLPDAWYITKEGYLYNTTGVNGHKESTLEYPFSELQCNLKCFDREINVYRKELEETINGGYVTPIQCKHYLNLRDKFTEIEKGKIYDRQLNMLIIGIIAAHIDLYEAFNNFYKMDDPMQEYFKMLRLTNCEMDDMFVRFLGMSKLGVSGTKTICTSNTNDRMFSEYIKRGYKIDLVNPIEVINNHIEEIDLNNHKIMKKVLDKNYKSAIKE